LKTVAKNQKIMPVAVVADAAPEEGSGSLLASMDKVDLEVRVPPPGVP
jgi:hypothetical protein